MISIQENILLKPLTTFKIGGPAKFFIAPQNTFEIQEALKWALSQNIPYFVLGKGSNLVISDQGYNGLIIHLGKDFSEVRIQDNLLQVQAGCLLNSAVNKAIKAGLGGVECLGGIPGTIGAGAWINAGAYGQELGDRVNKVTTIDQNGNLNHYSKEECQFSYRHSIFVNKAEIIVEVELSLEPSDAQILHNTMTERLQQRRDKQPVELPNAGSMFKRPPGLFAGALIEQSGLKGFRVGDAQVSTKHAGFVVNIGNATAQDVWNLTEHIIAVVQKDHNVILQREVIFLGDF